MLKNLTGHLKTLFGLNSKKQEEFDQAMLAVFNAAVKINRISDELRDDCLGMVRFFSDSQSAAGERTADGLAGIDSVFEKASRILQEDGKPFR